MTTTETKNAGFREAEKITDAVVDSWLKTMDLLADTQEQGEKVVRSWMDQHRAVREENRKLTQRMADQVRTQQREMNQLWQRSVELTFEAMKPPATRNG
ncbi:MAG: hypothetical protein HY319_08265 [Armatimonadetes bacterium]|nr:hypothetical protein [Armatimonadota bacterium]